MPDENSKPSLASGMARRGFWIGAAAGIAVAFLRFDLFDDRLKAVIGLCVLPLALIAIVFGLIALIRITSADRKDVLVPGLVTIFLSIYSNYSLFRSERASFIKARAHATATEVPTQTFVVNARPVTPHTAAQVKSNVPYELPEFDAIPEKVIEIKTDSLNHSGDDAAVLRAWAAHLQRLYETYTNTITASNALHQVDLVDPRFVRDFKDDEAIRRRRLSNEYGDAWHKLDNALSAFSGSFYQDMQKEPISPNRWSNEGQALSAFVEKPEIAARITALRNLCKAEENVGRYYNYAVSAVFDYARFSAQAANVSASFQQQMQQAVRNLRDVEQSAGAVRRELNQPAKPL